MYIANNLITASMRIVCNTSLYSQDKSLTKSFKQILCIGYIRRWQSIPRGLFMKVKEARTKPLKLCNYCNIIELVCDNK